MIGDIETRKKGEEVFRQNQSIIFKKLTVRRIYDQENEALVYLVYSRRIVDGSAKMSIASIPLYGEDVTWTNE
jgi:CreA protein